MSKLIITATLGCSINRFWVENIELIRTFENLIETSKMSYLWVKNRHY
jgi:hypothetical protein